MTSTTLTQASVGDRFELVKPALTTEQLVRYAGASDDYNRIHYDLPYAQAAGLGGVIAHGMLTMGFMAQAITDWTGPAAFVQQIEARFARPVRPGDIVSISVEIEARDSDTWRCILRASVGEHLVASGHAVVRRAQAR
ncbi:MaoC/PaaZ C-terminal domain-containing protein [Caballeronia sp. LZ035]|uniref:MaoC/PaaZ C-terminal domain-containing protein n=1 Tax=Caballeronia sp. LZ035 TaxID=3038568 RepID=UPI00285FBBCA|nr:MaoC/PaaZ C-terminal domain-containing protein [Caballeronia sp. LZ035]MDR5760619.1 MaoC/PaaZ C-terminal domain-containing protein [Caballeronia sp. LZ035]